MNTRNLRIAVLSVSMCLFGTGVQAGQETATDKADKTEFNHNLESFGLNPSATFALINNGMAHQLTGLQGNWTGQVHSLATLKFHCHQAVYRWSGNLHLHVEDHEANVTGILTFDKPVIGEHSCSSKVWADWSTQLQTPTLCFDSKGRLSNDGTRLHIYSWNRCGTDKVPFLWNEWDATGYKMTDHGYYSARDIQQEWRFVVANNDTFVMHYGGNSWIPMDASFFSDNMTADSMISSVETIDGVFHRDGSERDFRSSDQPKKSFPIAGWLVAILAYLAILGYSGIMNPSSSKFLAGLGGIVGLGEALKAAGYTTIARHARLGGFLGASIAEGIELGRIYKTSTDSNESFTKTAWRLGISFNLDLANFVASGAIMDAAAGVIITATGFVGSVGAIVVGVAGAGILLYGVSATEDRVKEWANKAIDSL